MFCENCGTENNDLDKFCSNCGAPLTHIDSSTNETKETNKSSFVESQEVKQELKKKGGFWKTLLIIFVVVIIILGLLIGTSIIFFKALVKESKDNINNYRYDYSESFDDDDDDDDEFDFDDFEKYFPQYFDEWDGDDFGDDEFNQSYAGTENFEPGTISNNRYKSTFASLDFTLPAAWKIYDKSQINQNSSLYNSKLFLYDLYAENTLDGSVILIAYYNKDYFNASSINDFNNDIKKAFKDDAFDIEIAKDSTITLNGIQYYQLACRCREDSNISYIYEFTREVNGYYMEISLISSNIDRIGDMIDILNSKG